jgi:hypothetical protein|eukprot:COSAG01_NODE_4697_length_4806_cov_2.403654_8_plen_35_part_00
MDASCDATVEMRLQLLLLPAACCLLLHAGGKTFS